MISLVEIYKKVLTEKLLVRWSREQDAMYGRMGSSTFYTQLDQGDYSPEFGEYKILVTLNDSAKIFKGTSSFDYIKDNNLLDVKYPLVKKLTGFNTLREVADYYDNERDPLKLASNDFKENPNIYYTAFQQICAMILEKDGYDGARWTREDDLLPLQYQIWNKNMISKSQYH